LFLVAGPLACKVYYDRRFRYLGVLQTAGEKCGGWGAV
jgi:hypothetical protein